MTFNQSEGDKLPSDHPMHNTNNLWAPRQEPDHSDRLHGVAGSNYVSNSPRGFTKFKARAERAGEQHDENHQHDPIGSNDQNFSALSFKGHPHADAERPDHTLLRVKSNTLTPSVTFTRLRPPTQSEPPKGGQGVRRESFSKEPTRAWLSKPTNLLRVAWLVPTVIVGVFWLLLTFGILNSAIPNKPKREDIKEICNQILNVLFVLLALCLQPVKTMHLFWLARWRVTPKDDIARLRAVYCKGGSRKPNERVYILVVLLLMHLTYLTTYVMAVLCWVYKRSVRPNLWVDVMFGLAVASGVSARLFRRFSPLGRDYVVSDDAQELDVAV